MANTPSRPQTSRSSSRSSNQEQDAILDLYTQRQAGRSAISLSAQRSAQSLRGAPKPIELPRTRSPVAARKLLQKKSRPRSFHENDEQSRGTRRQSFFVPVNPSPLNPAPGNIKNATDSRRGRDAAEQELARPKIQHYRSSPVLRITVPELRLPEVSQPKSAESGSEVHQPKSVRDLGSDYTRYFSPLGVRRNSVHDIGWKRTSSRLAVCSGGLLAPDVSRRLSDPFKDSKRISNPFESALDAEYDRSPHDEISPVDTISPASVRSTAPLRPGTPIFVHDANPEKPPLFQYLDDRLAAPAYAFPLMTDQKEDDDDLHMPLWDDDIRLKPKLKDHFTRENIVSTFGLILMVTGLLFIFVVLPVISYTGTSLLDYYYETPLDEMPGHYPPAEPWAWVSNRKFPLLQNIQQGLIDPDTPEDAQYKKGVDGKEYVLVFSDEFNRPNRTFYPGDDPYWFGFEGWYSATNDLEWYDPIAINTGGGTLLIQMDEMKTHNLNFRSGMLNSWNQLCFKGGIFEVSMSLPGPAGKHGLWPGVWTMGNLGRPGYLATTDGLWPYTYNSCDAGITANQSSSDGMSYLPGQRLPSCACSGEDHPTPGKGRGAPEIDIAEMSVDWGGVGIGVATQSYQVAPFDIWYYPNYDFMQNPNYNLSLVNTYTGGPYQQAVSTTTMLNNKWYDGHQYQKFAFEYSPGDNEKAFVAWTVGDEETMRFDARALSPNGNIGQRIISEEPMSMIMNLGISNSWTYVDYPHLRFPTVMRIDYVRWYQKESEQIITCDPPGYETTEYIRNHPAAYRNPNVTMWKDAGYSWPKNTLVDACSA